MKWLIWCLGTKATTSKCFLQGTVEAEMTCSQSPKALQQHHGTNFPKPRSFMWTKENPSHTRLKETKVRALELERRIRGFQGKNQLSPGRAQPAAYADSHQGEKVWFSQKRNFPTDQICQIICSKKGLMETRLIPPLFSETTCWDVICDMEKKAYRKFCECRGSTVAVWHRQALASRESSPFRGHSFSMLSYLYYIESE